MMDKCLQYVKEGDIVSYGNYYNRKRWVVVSKSNNKALLVSYDVVDNRRFDAKTIKWSKSEIRKWLNGTYYQEAFNKEEKSRIISVNGDKVFLLSTSEYNKYQKHLKIAGSVSWWLRSPNSDGDFVFSVTDTGLPYTQYVTTRLGVRPAIWIDLSK